MTSNGVKKDFKKWHDKKRHVHNERPRVHFHVREIWFCYLGENVGFEQDGTADEFLRPVVVLKKFNRDILFAVPLSKHTKKDANKPFYFKFSFQKGVSSMALLSQLRLIDAKRLKYKTGNISEKDFKDLKAKIRRLIA